MCGMQTRKSQVIFAVAMLAASAVLGATNAVKPEVRGDAAKSPVLFRIGKPDGSSMEFGLVREKWHAFTKTYPNPIEFTIGSSKLTDWPYIHPSTHDKWAGGKAQTFTIHFHLDRAPEQPVFLIIGALSIWEPSQITITANGKKAAVKRLPDTSSMVELAGDPTQAGKPTALIYPIPEGAITAGDNAIGINLTDGSWIIYDYVQFGTTKSPPKLADTSSAELIEDFLAGPMAKVDEVVFAERKIIGEHWYANFGTYAANDGKSYDKGGKLYREGGKLCKLNIRTKQVATLIDDPKGGVRDPQVSYDGKKILFAYRKDDTENYHLHEMNVDGTGLKQLTDGPWDDIEPTYVPDGGIVFVSNRCKRWVNCWLTQVAVLHRCDADGKNIHEISSNNEHDNTPWPMPDGRLLYTRWEYVDRSQVHYHHLWATYPDGTAQTVFYGNLHPGIAMLDAKPIPNSDKFVVSFSPGHGQAEHQGVVTVVDPKAGPDAQAFAKSISKGNEYRDPWAFSETCFMAATGPRLVVMDAQGQTQDLYKLTDAEAKDGFWLHEPRPIIARQREPTIITRIKPEQPMGKMFLADVYNGRNMDGVKPGEIKKLLVLESLPKPINFTGGMDPLSYGGTFTLEHILGTVPVEADGSALFEVPAVRSVFFVALDEHDLAVKRMQSFSTVQPGETLGCVGCHEHRIVAPKSIPMNATIAAQRAPSKIEPFAGVPDIFDFPRDVQPVLDALCVSCHGYDKTPAGGPRAGRLILSGDHGPMFSHGYYMMTIAHLFSDGRNQPKSNYAPRTLGSSASKILTMLDGSHYGVKATDAQKKTLRLWIESSAAYPGTYAALGTGMIGGYAQNNLVNTDTDWPTTKAGAEVIARRCDACHDEPGRKLPHSMSDEKGISFWQPVIGDARLNTSRHIVFNLSRPEKSMLVLAPLAESAGGWGTCRDPKTKQPATVFANTNDPDYQKLLAMCAAGKTRLDEIKRFDMPGFKPRIEYVREMRRYGVLPEDIDYEKTTFDPYDLDRRYWQSLWYHPPQTAQK